MHPCPSKLPHDIELGQWAARWFGPPYNSWHVGKVKGGMPLALEPSPSDSHIAKSRDRCSPPCATEVNKKRTKQENVCVAFDDGDGMFLADAESYGADKLWCLLKPIPIELSESEAEGEPVAKRARADGDFVGRLSETSGLRLRLRDGMSVAQSVRARTFCVDFTILQFHCEIEM